MLSDAGGAVQHLMHFSTKPGTAASAAAVGSFSAPDAVEYVLMSHDSIELHTLNSSSGDRLVHRQSLQCTLLNIATVPSDHAGVPDILAVTSESGFLTLLKFDPQSKWTALGNELLGRSGIRSSVPGEYLCSDPQGRCVFVAAPFKEKRFFRVSRNGEDVVLHSPLEARRHSVVFSAVPVIYQGSAPTFATLESNNKASASLANQGDTKQVCFYSYDLNLNQVRTVVFDVPSDATFLAPCFNSTPGVLVCTPFTVFWLGRDSVRDFVEVSLPLRHDNTGSTCGSLITGSAFFRSAQIFFLIQNENGDLFRVRLDNSDSPVSYFGHVQPGASLSIIRGGYLLNVGQTGDHQVFKITREQFPHSHHAGTIDVARGDAYITVPTFSTFDNSNMVQQHVGINTSPCYSMRMGQPVRGRMRYFSLTHSRQLHCTSYGMSTVPSTSLSLTRQGADAIFLLKDPVSISRDAVSIECHSRLLVSFRQETTVYRLTGAANNVLPEEPESQLAFDTRSRTIFAALLDGGCFLQVTPAAVHAVRGSQRSSWFIADLGDPSLQIQSAAANRRQIIVSFTEKGLATIEFDSQTGVLKVAALNMRLPLVDALAIPPIRGAAMATVIGIGSTEQGQGRFAVFSFDSLELRSNFIDTAPGGAFVSAHATYLSGNQLHMFMGTRAGQLIRACVTEGGAISSFDPFQLGQSPCRILSNDGQSHCYAQSDEIWRCSFEDGVHHRIPVSLPFSPKLIEEFSLLGKEGLLAFADGKLVPLSVEVGSGSLYTTQSLKLYGTGRKLERIEVGSPSKELLIIACRDGDGIAARSSLQVQDTSLQFTSQEVALPPGDSIISMATGIIPALGSTPIVLVGIATRFCQSPKLQFSECRVALYTLNGMQLESQPNYVTQVPDLPSAIHITPTGHVIVGMGEDHGLLALECGRSRFLQKHRLCDIRSRIVAIDSSTLKSPYAEDGRASFLLACGTTDSSVIMVRFHNSNEKQFLIRVGHDAIPRSIIAVRFVTSTSLVCTDRFGNVSFMAVPEDSITDIPDNNLLADTERQRQLQLLRLTGQFHVGQLVNSIDVVSVPKREPNFSQTVVVYSTIVGSAGCFVPFQREEDAVFGVLADSHIRSASPSLVQRTTHAHQSSFYPPCGVVDGDNWQRFCSSQIDDSVARRIVESAKASDKRMALLGSSTEVPRFNVLTTDGLLEHVKAILLRTKPSSIF